jgi:acyl-CoA thioesterase-1
MKLWALALCFAFLVVLSSDTNAQNYSIGCPESAQYYSKDSVNIVTFGASTVQGLNGSDFQSYLTTNFINCYKGKVVNIQKYAVPGETTGQGLLRIDKAIENKTGFMVLLIGANDAVHINAGRLTLAETETNMRKLIVKSLNQNLTTVICTIQFFDDRNNTLNRSINTQIRQINQLYKKLALEYHIYLADLNAAIRRDFSLYQDLVHPNARGNRLISFVLFDTINKIIAEKFLEFVVSQNYPNPARTTTAVDIVMPEADKITFKLYNMQGKLIQTVLNEYLNTGKHTIQINVSYIPAGVYIYKITKEIGTQNVAKKLLVMH